NNVNPNVTAAANQDASEGASTSFTLGSFTDPGADSPWSVDVNWGDGSVHITYSAIVTGSLGTKTHTYDDGPSTHTVTVTVSGKIMDKDGGSNEYTTLVSVNNVAPSVTAPANQSANEGESKTFSLGSFSDPGVNDSPWNIDVNWGDGTAHTTFTTTVQGAII